MSTRRRRVVVAAALCRRRGAILLTRRRADQPMPHLWELPGGKVEEGEDPAAALRREMFEELGVDARPGRPYEVVHHRYDRFDLLMIVYRCRVHGTPRPLEVAEVRWVEPSRLGRYKCLPADAALMRRLASGSRRTRRTRRR